MATYHWYCPDCDQEDYNDYPGEDEELRCCPSCGGELCKLEPGTEGDSDSKKGESSTGADK